MNSRISKRGFALPARRRIALAVVASCCAAMLIMPTGEATERTHRIKTEVHSSSATVVHALETATAASGSAAFLKDAGFLKAWPRLSADVTALIAVVDTGVDFNHPALKPYLLPGKNLVNANRPPQDDNGHGTAVAGVIAAVAEADDASAKAEWKGRILPIKALDQNGSGDESKLTQAIDYAVEQGADIVVLSLGLRRDAPRLREAVARAESKGVLLVAASGNDAAALGSKAAVQYPAAYDSVLAVSGSEGLKPVEQSTPGVEVDVSASWTVDTLAVGGGHVAMAGSSMGAPQAAAAAALLMAAHPDWKPLRLREALRGTATSPSAGGWDPSLGYGFLAVDRAIGADGGADWREPNNARAQAGVFPLGKEAAGAWSSANDVDWYAIDVPYAGTLSVTTGGGALLGLYGGLSEPTELRSLASSDSAAVQWSVIKGRYWLKASKGAGAKIGVYPGYRLASAFTISADAKEPNDSAATAITLPPRSQQWTGTFHRRGDEDWTAITLPKDGELSLSATTDTSRIDLALMVQPAGGAMTIADERGDGGSERLTIRRAKAGRYFMRITNAVSANPEPVIGTYNVMLEYITQYEDPYEPNNSPVTATPLSSGDRYDGTIATAQDVDWYRFTIGDRQKASVSLEGIVSGMTYSVVLADRKQQTLNIWKNGVNKKELSGERVLEAGTYYVSVAANRGESNQPYRLIVTTEPTQDAFADLAGYRWASPGIGSLVEAGWMNGYPDGTFRPAASLTRGEAIASLVRAIGLKPKKATMRFRDIAPDNWLYESVAKADQAGWLSPYAGTLQPGAPLARGEAATLFAAALSLDLPDRPKQVFKDVPAGHALAATTQALEEQHWLSGYPDGNFRPNATITRAEWSVLLAKLRAQTA